VLALTTPVGMRWTPVVEGVDRFLGWTDMRDGDGLILTYEKDGKSFVSRVAIGAFEVAEPKELPVNGMLR